MNNLNPWAAEFGRLYTDRNDLTPLKVDKLYLENYGITRSQLNDEFLSDVPLSSTMLEVGCNLGLQLQMLKKRGHQRLSGIDISFYALDLLRTRLNDVNLSSSSAICIPFKAHSFEIVYSSGVLIHINPMELNTVLDEIYRCSSKYIWCFEYYADVETEIEYRNKKGMMWKADFMRKFTERFHDLSVVRTKKLKYTTNDNIDIMFLLKKKITYRSLVTVRFIDFALDKYKIESIEKMFIIDLYDGIKKFLEYHPAFRKARITKLPKR